MFQGSDKKSKRKTVCLTLHGPELLDEAVKNRVFIFIQGAGDRNTFFSVTIKKNIIPGSLANCMKCSQQDLQEGCFT